MATYKRWKGKKVKRGEPDYGRGTWYAAGQVDGVRYHQALKTAKTADDARVAEAEIISKIRVDEFGFLKDKTKFVDFINDVYLPYAQMNNANYKQKFYECRYLKDFFKAALLKAITPQMCERYKAWRLAQKKRCQKCVSGTHEAACAAPTVKTSTVNRELTTLKKALNVAIQNRLIKDSPMRHVKLLTEPPTRERFLSLDEKTRLFDAIGANRQLLSIVLLGLSTGWRKGQILGVRKGDLDAEHMAATIKRSKRAAARKVPVSLFAWSVLSTLAETADDYLFTNRDGRPLGDFKESWWAALKTAGIEDFHFHDLRHSFATDMLADGTAIETIQKALGHTQTKTTGIYAHVLNKNLQAALEGVGNQYQELGDIS
jgi:integrase